MSRVRLRELVAGVALAAFSGVVLVAAVPAQADEHWWHDDIHHFHERDVGVWRGGHWYHGIHGGRPGWWWIVGGVWYFYPRPIYPYPDPYVPPVVAAPPANYYWCASPPGYYPQQPTCAVPWQAVPAAAAAPPPPPALAPTPVPQPPPPGATPAPPNAPPPPPQ
jgi:hypothetical protein